MESRRAAADLKIRAATLLWDARRDGARALALIDRIDHPAAPALRLDIALATDGATDGGELLKSCIAEARRRIDAAELAELGRILIWRSSDERRVALQLLEAAGADGRVVRELGLAVEGRWPELCTLLEGQVQGEAGTDVAAAVERAVEAADLAENRLKDRARADTVLQRAFERKPRPIPTGRVAYFLERLQAILELPTAVQIEVLRQKRTLLTPARRTSKGPKRRATCEYKASCRRWKRAAAMQAEAARAGNADAVRRGARFFGGAGVGPARGAGGRARRVEAGGRRVRAAGRARRLRAVQFGAPTARGALVRHPLG